MATIGHVAAGVALGRGAGRGDLLALAVVTAAAVAPDIDFAFDLNHRGPTHSVGFALVVGLVAYLGSRLAGRPDARTIGLLAIAAVGSHIILDLLTAHSPVAVAWPLSTREFVLPVIILPAAPGNDSIFSARGAFLLGLELIWSGALIVFAESWRADARRRRRGQADPIAATTSRTDVHR